MFRKTRTHGGFTLIEVTLAIVIGIVMIAGATLIYNQAKTSAGNSRAQTKVVSLQQLVEEYAAQNQGIYPAKLGDVQTLFARKRPDDFLKSPWGGQLGNTYTSQGPVGVGVGTNQIGPPAITVNTVSQAGTPSAVAPVPASLAANPGLAGGLVYDYDGTNNTNTNWTYAQDLQTNSSASVKGYAVYICDMQGMYPNFVTGGRQQ